MTLYTDVLLLKNNSESTGVRFLPPRTNWILQFLQSIIDDGDQVIKPLSGLIRILKWKEARLRYDLF